MRTIGTPILLRRKMMTWSGHEFLDHIRQDTAWNKVKGAAREKGLELSLDVIVSLAKTIINSLL
jgi:hypothetical protein